MHRKLLNSSRLIFLFLGAWLVISSLSAQNIFSSEEELKKQANKLFEEEDFAKAYPLFSQLLSLYPKDAQYNYKFGTCLLFSSNEKEKAVPYIEYAAKRQKQGVEEEVFFYLGKAYHLNYRFGDAIRQYTIYKNMASAKKVEKYDVDRQIEMCENGTRLLKSVTELSVLEKKEVPESEFFRSYNLSEFNAKLIIKPEDLKTSYDKKKKDASVMYLAPDREDIYFSSYGEDGKNGRDIFYVKRTASGDLSKPVRVTDGINTKYDEDYVFLHPNGKTLYFCSKGHNSMGGYDIFKCDWNENSMTWGKPKNMDFAINTPDDDILFISDAEDKSAYFSSRRENAMGSITVYKIKLERKPLDIAIIKGVLAKETGDKMPNAKITVTKIPKEEVVGVFNTNAADGSYSISLPNGGRFMFSVESAGFKKASELVVIPPQQEIKPLKQEITLVNENGQDKIVVKNEFDAQIDSTDLALAIQYIKSKASLAVSPPEEMVSVSVDEKKEENRQETKTEATNNVAPVTNMDIIEMAYKDAKETQKDANDLIRSRDAAQQLANKKNELSIQKYKEGQELMKSAETITNQEEKIKTMDHAASLKKESETLSKEAAVSLTLSNQLSDQAKAKQEQADAELKYAKEMDNAIKTNASETKMNELLTQKEELDKKSDNLKTSESISAEINKMAEEKQVQANKVTAKYVDVKQDMEDLQSESRRLRSEAEKTKNEGAKQNMIQQAEDIDKEAEGKKKDADALGLQARQLQMQADSLKSNAAFTTSVMKEIEGSPATTVSSKTSTTGVTAPVKQDSPATTASPSTAKDNSSQPSGTITIHSPYVSVFIDQMHEAEKKTNELEKEEALAVIYQSWTDSLDNQLASLKKQLAAESNETNKAKIQDKIYELQSSVDDKRQKAAESRSSVDNLKLKAALETASTISADTTTKTTTATENNAAPEIITGVKNINEFYANKLKETEKSTNEYEKKEKERQAYEDWAAALYDESQRLKKDGKGNKAEDADKESKAKQVLAMQAADQVAQIKVEHPELVQDAAKTPPAAPTSTETKTKTETETAVQPLNTSTTAVTSTPDVQPVSTQTLSPTIDQPSAQTPTAVTSNTITSTAKTETEQGTSTAAVNTPAESVPESVKNKDEYVHYTSLKKEAEWSKSNSARQYKQAEELEKIANEQFKNSQAISQQIGITTDPNERQKLQQQSDELDKSSLRNQAKADSVKKVAQNSSAEANAKRREAELYLQSIDKAAYEEIAVATGRIPKPEPPSPTQTVTAQAEPPQPTAIQLVNTPTTSVTSTPVSTTSSMETKKTETQPETNLSPTTSTETKTKPEVQSTVQEPRPVSTDTITASVPDEAPVNPSANNTTKNISESPTLVSPVTPIKNTPANTTNTIPGNQPTASPTASNEILKYYDALFDKLELEGSSYSSSQPIPVDAPMPDGLIFKVQIGAFKNPIPQNLFKGIKPITAETTPRGLKRYTAGLFKKFETANNAKGQVTGMGYRDAFVVAFFNGKRISMDEALAKAKEAGEDIDLNTLSSAASTAPARPPASAGTSTANATDVRSVSGLFYTIQIGVFSKSVPASQLYNISPLNSDRADNGLIRYTTGRFIDEVKANAAKNNISAKGISDAFVVAYYNGKRISLAAAKTLIDSQGEGVLSKEKQEYSILPSDTTTSESSATTLTVSSNSGIVFKVQVGAYKEQVPISEANRLLTISNKGIKTFRDANGLLVYTVGEFLEYESANSLKNQVVSNGISGAFVIAFKDGKKITASEAIDIIKNK